MAKDDVRRLIERIQSACKRHRYDALTVEILAGTPDDELLIAIQNFIWAKIGSAYKHTLRIVSDLPASFQMVYSLSQLDGQVRNGGFNQYFFNTKAEFADLALSSLQLIGATEAEAIVKRAIEIY